MRLHCHMLEQMLHLLDLFLSEIQYDKATFRECCERIAFVTDGELKQFFETLCGDCVEQEGESFLEIFRNQMDSFLQNQQIPKEERDFFLDAFRGCGMSDRELTIRTMKRSQERILRNLTLLENGKREKCRLSMGLGTMGGLFLVILLL